MNQKYYSLEETIAILQETETALANADEDGRLVKEVMSPGVLSVDAGKSLVEVARTMRDLDVDALPVRRGGRLVGMITDRDICRRAVADGRDPWSTTIGQVMSAPVAQCFDDQACVDAAQLMERNHVHRLAVFDRGETLVGLISVGDLARVSHDLAGEVLDRGASSHH